MDNTLSQRLAELQAIFHSRLPGKIATIRNGWESLREQWSTEQLGQLHRLSHSLAGSSGSFGAHEVGQAARELEQRLKALVASGRGPDKGEIGQIDAILVTLINRAEQWDPEQGTTQGKTT